MKSEKDLRAIFDPLPIEHCSHAPNIQ